MSKQGSRRIERSKAFQVLYCTNFIPAMTIEHLQNVFNTLPSMQEAIPQKPMTDNIVDFAWELVEGVWRNTQNIDALIGQFSQNWRIDRLGKIELTLLRIAVFEMLYRPDIPHKVALNEALELTAHFGDTKAKKFINGILDTVIKALLAGTLTYPVQGSFS